MGERVAKRAFKYRFYPSPVQADQLAKTFGCVRYVYNRALAERSRAWTQEQRRVTHAETDKLLTGWKRDPETEWLEYKAEWYGRTVIPIDRFYPSSKTCSACGAIVEKLPLNVREWTCRCGAHHDRDVNAAKNLAAAGRAVLASGAGVSPLSS